MQGVKSAFDGFIDIEYKYVLTNFKLQASIHLIPNSQLLLETDESEVNIFKVYQKISEIKKISLRELQEIIEENFKNTFLKWSIG